MWRYIVSKESSADGSEVYGIREYYPKYGWTEQTVKPVGDTREELIADLKMMLQDAELGDVLDIDTGEVQ